MKRKLRERKDGRVGQEGEVVRGSKGEVPASSECTVTPPEEPMLAMRETAAGRRSHTEMRL